jgi:hypothetical protein
LPLFEAAKQRARDNEVVPRFPKLRAVKTINEWTSTGLLSVDQAMRGGFPVGAISLVASKPRAGVNSLLMGAVLANLEGGLGVGYFSEKLREDQIRGRLVVLKSKVNGYRFRAGVVTDEDHQKLDEARSHIAWSRMLIRSAREIPLRELDSDIFSYHPQLVIADLRPRGTNHPNPRSFESLTRGIEELAFIAARDKISMVVRCVLPEGPGEPDRLELPGLGTVANLFNSVIFVHRNHTDAGPHEENGASQAQVKVIRVSHRDVGPRYVNLHFDQRYAGLEEISAEV